MANGFLTLDYGDITKSIARFISGQVKARKKNGIVIGLSGGIDSSVCLLLACRALGNKGIIGLSMPEKDVTSKTDLQNARSLARKLKIRYKEINIKCAKRVLLKQPPRDKLAEGIFQQDLGWPCFIIMQQSIIY